MTKQAYDMIEGQVAGSLGYTAEVGDRSEGASLLQSATPLSKKGPVVAVLGAVVALALLVVCLTASPRVGTRGADNEAAATPMQASSIAACSLMECTSSGCDWDSAPFLCTGGGSTRGCADKASTWATGDGCTSFCDLSGCADTLEKAGTGADGAEALPRRCLDCDEDQCSRLAAQWSQACGKAAPFMCLAGAATWGCADNELAWASAPSTTCGECCDVGGC